MGASALALTALEVAVGGRRAALLRGELVGVHAEAHRAAGTAPLAARLLEDHVEALVLGLEAHAHGAGDDEQAGALGDVASGEDLCGCAQVLDPAVGARADEDGVDVDVAHRRTGLETHVLQGLAGSDAVALLGVLLGVRDRAGQRHALSGVGAPGDERRHGRGVEDDLLVEDRVVVGDQRAPVRDGGVPVGALGRLGPALEVVERGLVGSDQAGLGAPLDAHVADRHARLHRERLDGRAAVLHDVPLAAAGAGVGDQAEDEVLGGDVVGQRAGDGDRHRLRAGLRQRLRGEHVLDLGGADAEREGAERAVRGGVGVAADDRHAGLGEPELRADDVDDALLDVAERVQTDAVLGGVATQRLDLRAADGVLDRLVPVERGDVVVLGGEGQVGTAYGAPGQSQAVEGLRGRHLVEEVEIDVEEVRLTASRGSGSHQVLVPDLLGQGPAHDSSSLLDVPALYNLRPMI